MDNINVVIVGGGSAGWITAGWLIKKNKNINVSVIESPAIPKIGVGESVTPEVANFFIELGVPESEWMGKTGAVYKLANKFTNWKNGRGESQYFSFNYPTDSKLLYRDISQATSMKDWFLDSNTQSKTSDLMLYMFNNKMVDNFDQSFNSQHHYMEKNVAPFDSKDYLLNPLYSWSQHINAELTAEYIRDNIAVPNGVTHLSAKILSVNKNNNKITSVVLEDGTIIAGDVFVDCSGMHKVLIKELDWNTILYKDNPIDRAWVCQVDYTDQKTEMVNYSQTIAQPHGWMFKITLYHRMGVGYCFSSSHISEEDALAHYKAQIANNPRRFEPRLIRWTPSRLECAAKDNVAAIGLSFGFVEPMEANALFTIISSVGQLSLALSDYQQTGVLDFKNYNERITYGMDDIADFAKVHYSLSQRSDTEFWNDMRTIGQRENHTDLVYNKYTHTNHTMQKSIDGYTLFPDYMWAQLAMSWGIDTSKWFTSPDATTVALAKLYFTYQEQKHSIVSSTRQNNYQWLKEHMFNNLSSKEWEQQYING